MLRTGEGQCSPQPLLGEPAAHGELRGTQAVGRLRGVSSVGVGFGTARSGSVTRRGGGQEGAGAGGRGPQGPAPSPGLWSRPAPTREGQAPGRSLALCQATVWSSCPQERLPEKAETQLPSGFLPASLAVGCRLLGDVPGGAFSPVLGGGGRSGPCQVSHVVCASPSVWQRAWRSPPPLGPLVAGRGQDLHDDLPLPPLHPAPPATGFPAPGGGPAWVGVPRGLTSPPASILWVGSRGSRTDTQPRPIYKPLSGGASSAPVMVPQG